MAKKNFNAYVSDPIRRVSRMVGYCLTRGNLAAAWELSAIIRARLSTYQRLFLAFSALLALDDDEYATVIRFIEDEG